MKYLNQYGAAVVAVVAAMTMTNVAFAHGGDEKASNNTAHGVHAGTVHGVISDSMCKTDHSAMIKSKHGTDAASCTAKCVSQGKKLVFCEDKTNIVYGFSNAKEAKTYAGKKVAITGHIDSDSKVIHIHHVKAE